MPIDCLWYHRSFQQFEDPDFAVPTLSSHLPSRTDVPGACANKALGDRAMRRLAHVLNGMRAQDRRRVRAIYLPLVGYQMDHLRPGGLLTFTLKVPVIRAPGVARPFIDTGTQQMAERIW